MNTATTARTGDAESYRRDGFIILPFLLSAEELTLWRRVVDAAVATREDWMPGREPIGDDYYQRVFTQRVNLHQTDEAVRELVTDERLAEIVASLVDLDGLRLAHDQALIKPAYGNPTALHVDRPFWSFDEERAATLWIALDDATPFNGCLFFLPGTHREPDHPGVEIGSRLDAIFDVRPEWRAIEPMFCPIPAGSAIVIDPGLAHGATANLTPRSRRAMTITYMPDDARWNGVQNVLSDEQVADLRPGDPLDESTGNPVVFRR